MDIVTQGLLGSSLAQSAADKREIRYAAAIGFVAGLLADMDVLIRSSSDPLLTIEYHRHFTHALFFVPAGSLLAALILFPFIRKRIAFRRLYLYSLLGYSLSGFLDVCTSYGTYWLWPFMKERIALNIISVFDPLFSLILVISVLLCCMRRRVIIARAGLIIAGCYLLIGFIQHERAVSMMEQIASEREHNYSRMVVKPTIGNLLLWRSIYENDNHFYIDAVRVGLSKKIYTGDMSRKFDPDSDLASLDQSTVLFRDIRRFSRFSDGYIALAPGLSSVLGDVRYAMLPTSTMPLWGIEIATERPDQHADFKTYRQMSRKERKKFINMLLGK